MTARRLACRGQPGCGSLRSPAARIVALVSPLPPGDPTSALNDAVNELIDTVREVKQARWSAAPTHTLHADLDKLFDDLGAWARLLVDQDERLGVSPLAFMPSGADRKPPAAWPAAASDEEIRGVVAESLSRLRDHVAAALDRQEEGPSRTALAEVDRGLADHLRTLGGP